MNAATPLGEIASRTPADVRSQLAAFLPSLQGPDFARLNWKAVSAAADAIRYEEARRHSYIEHTKQVQRARRKRTKLQAVKQ